VSADFSASGNGEPPEGLSVRAHFKVSGEQAAQAVAAKMIDRAHEIANMPDCECDVDVSVEWVPPEAPSGAVELAPEPARDPPVDR
jgi:hypothetical protein